MGSNNGADDEAPVHKVSLNGYCMDVTEVTVKAYFQCVQSGRCTPSGSTVDWPGISEKDRDFDSRFCNGNRPDRQDHPVNCVNWHQATTYCEANHKRLPTEEEWEYAARSGAEQRVYPWGDEAPSADLVNACGSECIAMGSSVRPHWKAMYAGNDGWETTAPVASFPRGRTAQGLYDMAGNVWEWTASPYCTYPKKDCDDSVRMVRGGGWVFSAVSGVRVTSRNRGPRSVRSGAMGFRCVQNQ
jgi:formylglycine-generating enzyme required for sulfatase activity